MRLWVSFKSSVLVGLCRPGPVIWGGTNSLPPGGSESPGFPHGPHWPHPVGEGEGCLITARPRCSYRLYTWPPLHWGEGSGASLLLDGVPVWAPYMASTDTIEIVGKGTCYCWAVRKALTPLFVSSNTTWRWGERCLVITRERLKSRLSLLPMLVDVGTEVLLEWGMSCQKISVLLGCPFPSPLTENRFFMWVIFVSLFGISRLQAFLAP